MSTTIGIDNDFSVIDDTPGRTVVFSFGFDGHFVATVDYKNGTAALHEALPEMDVEFEETLK